MEPHSKKLHQLCYRNLRSGYLLLVLPLVLNVGTALLSVLKSRSTGYFFICFQHWILKLTTKSQTGVTKRTSLLHITTVHHYCTSLLHITTHITTAHHYCTHLTAIYYAYRSFINLHQDVHVLLCLTIVVSGIRREYIKLFCSVDIYFL